MIIYIYAYEPIQNNLVHTENDSDLVCNTKKNMRHILDIPMYKVPLEREIYKSLNQEAPALSPRLGNVSFYSPPNKEAGVASSYCSLSDIMLDHSGRQVL